MMPYSQPKHDGQPHTRTRGPTVSKDEAEAMARTIRSGRRWRELRAAFIARNPLCADPLSWHAMLGQRVPAEDVHHVVPLREAPHMAYCWSNLLSLCRVCHEAVDRQRAKLGESENVG
jgi:5-methylcytosine-specific restriction endonuclease McrA